jgi:platelet-activating factor acetylhydrolase
VRKALGEYVQISVDFIEFLRDGTRGGVLNESVTHSAYNKWVSADRVKTFSKERAKYWEVHVTPSA